MYREKDVSPKIKHKKKGADLDRGSWKARAGIRGLNGIGKKEDHSRAFRSSRSGD